MCAICGLLGVVDLCKVPGITTTFRALAPRSCGKGCACGSRMANLSPKVAFRLLCTCAIFNCSGAEGI